MRCETGPRGEGTCGEEREIGLKKGKKGIIEIEKGDH